MEWFLVLCVICAAVGVVTPTTVPCVTCDFDNIDNPFYDCYSRFSPIMRQTLLDDCAAKYGTPSYGKFIENIVLLCDVKYDMQIDPNSNCDNCKRCDFDHPSNKFNECFESFGPMMQYSLLSDCQAQEMGTQFDQWIKNVVLLCGVKFSLDIDCGCRIYTISGADAPINAHLINGDYVKVEGETCPGPNGEAVPVYQKDEGWYFHFVAPFGWISGSNACTSLAGAVLFTSELSPENADQSQWIQWDGDAWSAMGDNNLLVRCTGN